jgi:hypothetical protein
MGVMHADIPVHEDSHIVSQRCPFHNGNFDPCAISVSELGGPYVAIVIAVDEICWPDGLATNKKK